MAMLLESFRQLRDKNQDSSEERKREGGGMERLHRELEELKNSLKKKDKKIEEVSNGQY